MSLFDLPPEISHYIRHTMPQMDGWCSVEKATTLAFLTLKHRPISAVEIGVFAGRSLFAIGLAMKHNGYGKVVGIDPWSTVASVKGFEDDPPNRDWWAKLDHDKIYQQAKSHLSQLGLEKHVSLFAGTSQHAMDLLSCVQFSWDLVHIDGNHSTEQALYDVEHYVKDTKPGGFVLLDDLDWSTVKPAQQKLLEYCAELPAVGTCGVYLKK